ncbi:response regulator receiver sensor hybrid histidine kinase [Fibrisoma limi BUZ 3]|uniref:histidine kinase n=1 Tax=Fibrisoma limi BUZ 3 TaxID=1185876 RepID=I2GJY5_9BACT|nr:response regulator [Fibrisoma limi]CCH54210.1 response regulator receiver sensor hybrid histidine kinase [Fibrisoma limi BUZ 3]
MITILVVDDELDLEPLMLNWFRRKIQQSLYAFRFAHSGREALTLLQNDASIDLVLLDINMPEMDGLTLLNELPVVNPLLRAVMVSAYGDMSNIRTAMNRGAFDFVCKPIDFKDLEVTIEKTAEHIRELHESRQLKVIDELKTRFFDNITHEFRTPLTLILSPVEKLLQQHNEPPDLHNGLLMIERNAYQLLQLINQLLDLAKLESGHLTLSPKAGNFTDFISQIIRRFEPLAHEKGLDLTFTSDLSDIVVFDAEKVEQIIYNLLTNALKFTTTGGVTVRLAGGPPVQITVIDTGIGIVAEKLPYIFNRFYQIQRPDVNGNALSFTNPGTGIGLSLVKELTELMGGTVSVSSVSSRNTAGRFSGTTFTVTLPLERVSSTDAINTVVRPALRVTASTRVSVNGSVLKGHAAESDEKPLVLVVEDNTELAAFVAGELTNYYRVLMAYDGDEGWQLAQAELPDVVLTDIMIPGLDGYELTHRLKTDPATNHIAVVMLTAKTAQTSRIEGLQQGADDYVSKPFHIDELRLRIHNLLVRQQTLRAHYHALFSRPETPLAPEALDPFLQKLHTIIEEHLDDSTFRVDELAHEVGMSRRTLHRKLTAVANLTINDFIRQYRLKRGATMLHEGRNVSETAYLVGYESPAHFSTVFKEFFGKTPSEYMGS